LRKVKNKTYHNKISKKRHLHELKRQDKSYSELDFIDSLNAPSYTNNQRKPKSKKIATPENFSFIGNTNESLEFFEDVIYYLDNVDHLIIDMRNTKKMTTEVLLYLISLHKINEKKGKTLNTTIRSPKEEDLIELMLQSGFSNYFRANINTKIHVDKENIFQIKDKETNLKNKVYDEETCREAIEFSLKFYKDAKFSQPKFRHIYNALVEMMQNTDDHAYDEDGELRNWYLFAIKLEKGISFFFFDNGKGVLKTAKKNILEKVVEKANFSYGHESLMQSVLNGDYRSATGLTNRNRGLPEINQSLTEDGIELPIILTNRIYARLNEREYRKLKYNFRGTLFIWILKEDSE